MTRVTLEITNPGDWQVLLPLLKRLKIHYKQVEDSEQKSSLSSPSTLEIINAGLPAFENFEAWMQEFDAHRKNDTEIPFREK